jgi:hypothetical protein
MNLMISSMTNSQLIRAKMRISCGAAHHAFGAFWNRPDLPAVMPAMLVLIHQIARATAPLMATAAIRSEQLAGQDPLCAALAPYFREHAAEEAEHPDWHLNDLDAAGIARADVLGAMPLPDVAAMMGAQYYWTHHYHPVMLLGAIAVLEGNPPTMELVDRLERESGLKPEAFRTYRFHGEVDPHHIAEFDAAVDSFPLSTRDIGLIGVSATYTANALAACVRRLSPSDSPKVAGR